MLRPRPRRRPRVVRVLQVALVSAIVAGLIGPVAGAGAATPKPANATVAKLAQHAFDYPAAQAKKKKKKKKKRKLCIVKRLVNGKLKTVFVRTYAYRYVKSHGKRHRKIVRVKRAMRAQCSKHCVKQKLKGGKVRTVYVVRKVSVLVKKGKRLVHRKRRIKVPALEKCPKTAGGTVIGTPVKLELQPGSTATLDFSAFTRDAPLTGTINGFAVGRIDISKDTQLTLTSAKIAIGSTPIFIDDDCGGDVSAAIATDPASQALLDTSKDNNAQLEGQSGKITSIVTLRIRAALDLRNGENGCNQPYLQTGWTESIARFVFSGKLDTTRGLKARLNSSSILLDDFAACLSLGPPTAPCSGLAVPLPFIVSSKVVATISFGNYGKINVQ
jgi:hypothetical protein